MKLDFSPKEAEELRKEYEKIGAALKNPSYNRDFLYGRARAQAESIINDAVLSDLSLVSVKKIAEENKGTRIKPLLDAGITSADRLYLMTEKELTEIDGIGRETAAFLRGCAEKLYVLTRGSKKIKMSIDNPSPCFPEFIRYIFLIKGFEAEEKRLYALLSFLEGDVKKYLGVLKNGEKLLRRLFMGGKKKAEVSEAYNFLRESLEGNFGKDSSCIMGYFENIFSVPASYALGDFAVNPVEYTGYAHKICPDLIGREEDFSDIPREILQKIKEVKPDYNGLKGNLRGYQDFGVRYILAMKNVLLGDEMGLGKTVQAIAAALSMYNRGKTHFAVICPASVLASWIREIKKFCSLPVTEIHGENREEEREGWIKAGGFAVTTYETAKALLIPDNMKIDLLISDEAHYIKNPETQRARAAERLCRSSEKILFMTGTALENNTEEMINLIRLLDKNSAEEAGKMRELAAAPLFRKKLAGVYLRRRREDVLTELPELIENEDWCRLNEKERLKYEESVLSRSFASVRRVSWNTDDIRDSSKALRLKEIAEEAEKEGRKIIVFTFFLATADRIKELFGEKSMPVLNGSVRPADRQKIVDDFSASPAGTVLPAQITAGGTGLNIQAASVVVIAEPQLKPSLENQAVSRAYRMGQVRNVLVHRLLSEDTADERIRDILEEKQKIFDAFADKSEFSAEEIAVSSDNINKIMEEEEKRIREKNASPY